ncbi:hypothetical protein Pmani_026354 [Petrolisthes manimaculis]|uniref:Uncharacterized protein n=1 Tax=Petrolisthes manimaculis TaxID=1843537 RepID=A0AAE1P5G3_9EUCA|nr:hypothetical protein Pmani_026354 [Petrolisthes manimaculis]
MEAGLLSFWTEDVLNTRRFRARQDQRLEEQFDELINITQDSGEVVLTVEQLLGAFLMLGLGSILGCIILIAEIFGNFN